MKYYLIAGEASGDLHCSNLMKSLKKKDNKAEFRFWGGDKMQAVGGTLVTHYKEMAYMGLIPVLLHLPSLLKKIRLCKQDIKNYHPDVVILVDYAGFNLRIAKFVKQALSCPIHYYISPKIWAWNKGRIKQFRKYVDKMFCILPFESEFFAQLNYPVHYVGNPSVDAVAHYRRKALSKEQLLIQQQLADKPIIAILPGSRRQEIKANLKLMLSVASRFKGYQLIVAGAPGIEASFYNQLITLYPAKVIFNQTFFILDHSYAALVASGTATLETALFRIPQVVCYKVTPGRLVRFIVDHFLSFRFISLVNLIAKREVVKEMYADLFTPQNIYPELKQILSDKIYRGKMIASYNEIIKHLGKPSASETTANYIIKYLTDQKEQRL